MDNVKSKEKQKQKSSNTLIWSQLGLEEEYKANQSLFKLASKEDGINGINAKKCVRRIRFICETYVEWVKAKVAATGKSEESGMNIYDLITVGFDINYGMNGFLADYRFVVHTKRDCLGCDNLMFGNEEKEKEKEKEMNLELECDINNCFIVGRSNRNKGRMTINNNERETLFFVSHNNKNNNNDNNDKNICMQQILDTLHCWIYHTPKINLNINELQDIGNENNENESAEIDVLIVDDIVSKIGEIIRKTKESSKRFRNARNARYESEKINKFVTAQNYKQSMTGKEAENEEMEQEKDNIAVYQSVVYGNDQLLLSKARKKKKKVVISQVNKSWMDEFYKEMERGQIKRKLMWEMYAFINQQQFESDSIYYDISNQKQSNLLYQFSKKTEENKLNRILAIILTECDMDNNLYDAGFRFFYWAHYQNNDNEWNVLYKTSSGQPAIEGNAGYSLRDWFIPKKYADFKQELLTNKSSPFSLSQYQNILLTATEKRANWIKDPNVRKLECPVPYLQQLYGINDGDIIGIHHIMAILFYCSFSDHSCIFSATFRRNGRFETDYLLKKRHSEYYFWGRYLRECVECFGIYMANSNISVFYHGICKTLLFESTDIRINGPISTTRDFTIAWTIFGATGIVLDIRNMKGAAIYFDCNYWTCYTNEDEKLFVGCRNPLQFMDIHDIPKQEHYKELVKVINICDRMFKGFPLKGIKPLNRDFKSLNKLIKCELNGDIYETRYDSVVPQYIALLFHQFLKSKQKVEISMDGMDLHFDYHSKNWDCDVYGFKKFRPIFIQSDESTIIFTLFMRLMKNLETITILNHGYQPYESSISLDSNFLQEIFVCFDLLLNKSNKIFNQFIIVNPANSIKLFITQNNEAFGLKGWGLKRIHYKDPQRKGECSETLSIYKLK